jgi:superfamily II DNA/RNA helicase
MLASLGLNVDEVNGDTPDRKERLSRFDGQRYGIMLNSMLLTEGWDCPSVDCIVVLRATKVRGLYCQMVGRGTRLSPETGKTDLLLLDFLWHSDNHDLCRPAHLICENAEVAAIMTENINAASCGPVDLMEAEEQAEGDAVEAREEALAKKLAELQHKKARLVDPLQYEMSIQSNDLASYVPAFGWEAEKPKPDQVEALVNLNINPEGVECAGKAEKIIEAVRTRQAAGLSTPKQIRFLEQKGFQHVGNWKMDQATRMIDRIAANKWRVPQGINPKFFTPPQPKPNMFSNP